MDRQQIQEIKVSFFQRWKIGEGKLAPAKMRFDFTNLSSFFGSCCPCQCFHRHGINHYLHPHDHLHLNDQQAVVPLDHVERVLARVIPDLEGALRLLHG